MKLKFDIQPKAMYTLIHNFAIAITYQNNNIKQNHAFLLIVNFVTLKKNHNCSYTYTKHKQHIVLQMK